MQLVCAAPVMPSAGAGMPIAAVAGSPVSWAFDSRARRKKGTRRISSTDRRSSPAKADKRAAGFIPAVQSFRRDKPGGSLFLAAHFF
jgi:hypothetical protein